MTAIERAPETMPAIVSGWVTPALAVACFANMVSTMALTPFLPSIAEEFGVSVALVGQIPTLTMLSAALLGLVAGPLADRYGYRRSVVVGLVAASASVLGIAVAPDIVPLFVAGLLAAVGRSIIMPTAQAIVSVTLRDEAPRRQAIAWIATGATAAPLVGIPVLTMVAALSHWRLSFAVVCIVVFTMAVVLWWIVPPDRPTATGTFRVRDVLRAYAPLLRDRPSVVLVLSTLLTSMGTWAVFTYMAAFFVQIYGYTTPELGAAYLICGIGTVLGTRIVGSRFGAHPRYLLIGGRMLGSVCLLAAYGATLPSLVSLVLLTIGALTNTMSTAATSVMLATDAPAGRGTTMTLQASSLSLGTAFGAAVGGLLLTVADFRAIGVVAMALTAASAMLVWRLHRRPGLVPVAV